jgi:uncharacterized protein (DUF1800 family)
VTTIWPSIDAAIKHSSHKAVAPLTWDPTAHLLSRLSFGPTAADRAYVDKHGASAWYAAQLSFARAHPGYTGHKSVAACGPLLKKSPFDVQQWLIDHNRAYGWDAMDQLTEVTLGLQAWSPAQVYETLVDLFSNHLNVPNHNGDLWNTRHAFDRDVIRPHVLGTFTDMLLAAAKHPAMLIYLSLAESTKAAVNENYGRELLELHTVGLHYSESDVKNVAKMLTGRTVDDNQHYLFDDYLHPTGKVTVLGFTHPNKHAADGAAAGDDLLRYLARHKYTAANLARKLCLRYVSDTPSSALVNAVANAYLKSGTAILPMVQTILRSSEFWESRGAKVRRPAENVVATIRALNPKVTDWAKILQSLHWISSSSGQVPLDWPAPNGYPDVAAAWRSAGNLLSMWNMHLGMAGGWWDGMKGADVSSAFGSAATSGAAIKAVTTWLTGMTFSKAHQAALQTFVGESADTPIGNSRLSWLGYPLAAVILDGPHHALR